MVHLPFYLQNSGLRKVKIAQQTAQSHRKTTGSSWNDGDDNLNLAGGNLLGRSVRFSISLLVSKLDVHFCSYQIEGFLLKVL